MLLKNFIESSGKLFLSLSRVVLGKILYTKQFQLFYNGGPYHIETSPLICFFDPENKVIFQCLFGLDALFLRQ